MNYPLAKISIQNLLHNLKTIQNLAGQSKVIAMVKANAYGHGICEISKHLQDTVHALGVARIDEALALRQSGIKSPIMLAEGVFAQDDLEICSTQNFWPVFHNQTQIQWLKNAKLLKPIKAWIKINTGMNRLGFDIAEAKNAYQILSESKNILQPIGIMSHFACADDQTHSLNELQISNFQKFILGLPGEKSLNNSAGIFNFPSNYDVVRIGLALYGASPLNDKTAAELNLKPVMTLKTQIIAIHDLNNGSPVGYGARFVCGKNSKIGVAAIGYGDGYSRTIQDQAPILVAGKKCQLAGRVSMDMITIDLGNDPNARIGDEVVLWGDGLPIDEVKKFSSCASYDLLCAVQSRVKMIYE
ncbi:MAG: alr [Rickettsiaceae bacterium]|jgi:alanine racemase|nr:alr [Rickettsiaceae bacterium]